MKKNYIQPATEAQTIQSMHVICGSGDLITSPDPGDPNTLDIF